MPRAYVARVKGGIEGGVENRDTAFLIKSK